MTAWWCRLGGLYVLIEADTPKEAANASARRFAARPGLPARTVDPRDVVATVATPAQVSWWAWAIATDLDGCRMGVAGPDPEPQLFEAAS